VQNPRKKRAYYYFSFVDKAPGINKNWLDVKKRQTLAFCLFYLGQQERLQHVHCVIALYFGAGFRVLLLGVKYRNCDG
jgi:hypothetical protein